MKKKTLVINDLDIAFLDNETEGGSVILFIHGNSLASDVFVKQFEDDVLSSKAHLLAIDMCGYGDSARSINPEKDYTVFGQVHIIKTFIETLKLEDVTLVGHSLGGNIALELAKICKQVKSLVMVASAIITNPMAADMYLPNPVVPLFFKPELSNEEINLLANNLFKEGAEIPSFIIEVLQKADQLTRTYILTEIMGGDYEDQLLSLKQLDLPIAVFAAENDQLVNPKYLEKTKVETQWKNEVISIENCGHLLFFEKPAPFNTRLLEFVNQL